MFLDAMAFSDASHGFAFSDAVNGQFVDPHHRRWRRDLDARARRPPATGPAQRRRVRRQRHQRRDRTGAITSGSAPRRRACCTRRTPDAPGPSRTTPVATGEATGIFSIAFRDARHGVVVGGIYTKESEAVDNVATSADGGATWQPPRARGLSGYPLGRRGRAGARAGGVAGRRSVGRGPVHRRWADVGAGGGAGYDAVSIAPGGRIGVRLGRRRPRGQDSRSQR